MDGTREVQADEGGGIVYVRLQAWVNEYPKTTQRGRESRNDRPVENRVRFRKRDGVVVELTQYGSSA